MDKHNFEILSGDTLVAVWKNGVLSVVNQSLLPLFLSRVTNAELWLETRAIDSHRANSRLLKKALRLTERDDISTVVHVNAATITDNYWVRDLGSGLTYADVRFTDDYFSNLALKGTYNSFNRAAGSKRTRTPELTNVGSFEKCWKLHNGRWWLVKRANHNEQFSELFICELGKRLGMYMAHYERGDGCVRSLDFTDGAKVNFEPAHTFMGDNEDYADVVRALEKLCPAAIPDYIRLIFMDAVAANPDRHTNNFGLLRDPASGRLLGLAPNYDNNMALISRGYPSKPKAGDLLISLFNELTDAFPEYRKYVPQLREETVREVVETLGMKVRTQAVIDLVTGRYALIKK